jgi:hypothetical protein
MRSKYKFHNIIVIRYFVIGRNVHHGFFFIIIRRVAKCRGCLSRGMSFVTCDDVHLICVLKTYSNRTLEVQLFMIIDDDEDDDVHCMYIYVYYTTLNFQQVNTK